MAAAYEWHNYGKSTIGNRSDIERVPIEKLQAFYHKWYQPDNVVLIVAGNFDPEKALGLVAKYFGAMPKPERMLPTTYTEEPPQDGDHTVVLRRVGTVGMVGLVYHIPAGVPRGLRRRSKCWRRCSTPKPSGRAVQGAGRDEEGQQRQRPSPMRCTIPASSKLIGAGGQEFDARSGPRRPDRRNGEARQEQGDRGRGRSGQDASWRPASRRQMSNSNRIGPHAERVAGPRRLAAAVPPPRRRRQGDAGRRDARRPAVLPAQQPHGRCVPADRPRRPGAIPPTPDVADNWSRTTRAARRSRPASSSTRRTENIEKRTQLRRS